MTSDYLTRTRTLEELDALFEQDRLSAAKIAKTVFAHEVAVAIANIGEINQVASARILADSQIASAKMQTDAEVAATLLLSKAEITVLQLEQYASGDTKHIDVNKCMILEISRSTINAISTTASEAMATIQHEAENAIRRMRENATKAIESIHAMAEKLALEVEAKAAMARDALAEEKTQSRTVDETAESAKNRAELILVHATYSRERLREATQKIIAEIEAMSASAIQTISEAMAASERRIIDARTRAIKQIETITPRDAT